MRITVAGQSGGRATLATAESSFRVTATHDGLGHISLWISLWNGWPMAMDYRVEALLSMDVRSSEDPQ